MAKYVFLVLAFFTLPSAAAEDRFIWVKLSRGVEVQIPENWWHLGKDHEKRVQAFGGSDDSTNLITVNSKPKSTYAALRITSYPPTESPEKIAKMSEAELQELAREMKQTLPEVLSVQGLEMIKFYGVRIEKIGGHPAFVTRYRRTGVLKGAVNVEVSQIFTSGQEIQLNLSYRVSEKDKWVPVLNVIKRTIRIDGRVKVKQKDSIIKKIKRAFSGSND